MNKSASPPAAAGGLLLLLLLSHSAFAQWGTVASVSLSADKIALADSVQLTLAVEGSAPLRIELPPRPEQLLAPASAKVWSIRPIGSAKTSQLEGGRERWEQRYRLSPFVPGEKVAIVFSPLKVTAGGNANASEVEFPSREVRVQTAIAEPKSEARGRSRGSKSCRHCRRRGHKPPAGRSSRPWRRYSPLCSWAR